MFMYVVLGVYVVFMLFVIYMHVRVKKVAKECDRMLARCVPGDPDFYERMKELKSVDFNTMCDKFWIPVRKFYEQYKRDVGVRTKGVVSWRRRQRPWCVGNVTCRLRGSRRRKGDGVVSVRELIAERIRRSIGIGCASRRCGSLDREIVCK